MRALGRQHRSNQVVADVDVCAGSVDRLYKRFGEQLCWYVPLDLKAWFTGRGISNVQELDWWQAVQHPGSKVRHNGPHPHPPACKSANASVQSLVHQAAQSSTGIHTRIEHSFKMQPLSSILDAPSTML